MITREQFLFLFRQALRSLDELVARMLPNTTEGPKGDGQAEMLGILRRIVAGYKRDNRSMRFAIDEAQCFLTRLDRGALCAACNKPRAECEHIDGMAAICNRSESTASDPWIVHSIPIPPDAPRPEMPPGAFVTDVPGTCEPPRCSRPPEGWLCTRVAGHPGPCAAWPSDQVQAGKGRL